MLLFFFLSCFDFCTTVTEVLPSICYLENTSNIESVFWPSTLWSSWKIFTNCDIFSFVFQSIRASGLVLLEAILFGTLLLYFPVSLPSFNLANFPLVGLTVVYLILSPIRSCSEIKTQKLLNARNHWEEEPSPPLARISYSAKLWDNSMDWN